MCVEFNKLIIFHILIIFQRSVNSYVFNPQTSLDGFLNVNKPVGLTSTDVTNKVKRIILQGLNYQKGSPIPKVGHGGTIDKEAQGVLAVGIGNSTKGLSYFLKGDKEYLCSAVFGYETNTHYSTGEITHEAPWDHINDEMIENQLNSMIGLQEQLAPSLSAKKINGMPLYRYVLKKMDNIPKKITTINIYKMYRIYNNETLPNITLYIKCSSGTYVRSIIRDLGVRLNSRATVTSLIRTKKCCFDIKDSIEVDKLDYDTIVNNLTKIN